MFRVAQEWNPRQALLKEIILKNNRFDQAVELCLEMHALVHAAEMPGLDTYEDQLWKGLSEECFRAVLPGNSVSIAWNLWHITRIEDITANILIAGDIQVFNSGKWQDRLRSTAVDTGNAMSGQEIEAFSSQIDMIGLKNYRMEVGRKTRQIIKELRPEQMKTKIQPVRIGRVLEEGGVLEAEESKWLLDFWGKKTVAGILLMPITRHQIVHLNDSFKIKEKFSKLYRQ